MANPPPNPVTVVETVFNATSDITTSGTSGIDQVNLWAQLSSDAADLAATFSPNIGTNVVALMAGGTAFFTGLGKSIIDFGNVDFAVEFGDVMSTIGGLVSSIGSIAKFSDTPLGVTVGAAFQDIGGLFSVSGSLISDYDAVQQYAANSPATAVLVQRADYLLTQSANLEYQITTDFQQISGTIASDWLSVSQYLSSALSDASSALSQIGSSGFNSDIENVNQDLSDVETPLDDFVAASGIPTSNLSIVADNTDASVGETGIETPTATIGFNSSADGLSQTIQTTLLGSDGSTLSTSTYSDTGGSGLVTSIDEEDADGTSQITTFNSDGSSTETYYSGPSGTGSQTETDQEDLDGTSQITIYNQDGSTGISKLSVVWNVVMPCTIQCVFGQNGSPCRAVATSRATRSARCCRRDLLAQIYPSCPGFRLPPVLHVIIRFLA